MSAEDARADLERDLRATGHDVRVTIEHPDDPERFGLGVHMQCRSWLYLAKLALVRLGLIRLPP